MMDKNTTTTLVEVSNGNIIIKKSDLMLSRSASKLKPISKTLSARFAVKTEE
jgi:hypothetical protein